MNESCHVNFVDVEFIEFLKDILVVSHGFNLVFEKCDRHLTIDQFLDLFLLIFKRRQYHMFAVNFRIWIIWIFHEHLLKS